MLHLPQSLQSWAAIFLQSQPPLVVLRATESVSRQCHLSPGINRVQAGVCCTAGDMLHLRVLRDGEQLDLSYVLRSRRPLVPVLHGVDCVPSYFIVGGLVFVPLSIPFLEHAYGGAPPLPPWPSDVLQMSSSACLATLSAAGA